MANFIKWIKEHPFSAALIGLGLGWAVKVSCREYMPEYMKPGYYGPETQDIKAKSLKRDVVRRRAAKRARPGELTGEFMDLLKHPPAI